MKHKIDLVGLFEKPNRSTITNTELAECNYNDIMSYLETGELELTAQAVLEAWDLGHQTERFLLEKIKYAYYTRGLIFLGKNRYNKAISDFQNAIEIDKNFTDAYCALGRAHLQQGTLEIAEIVIREVLLDSNYQPARVLLKEIMQAYYAQGLSFLNANWYDEAISSFQNLVEIDPDFQAAHCNIVLAFLKQGKLKEAVSALEKTFHFVEIDPDFQAAHYNVVLAFLKQGKLKEAVSVIEKISHLNFFSHQPEGILLQIMKRSYYIQKSRRSDTIDVAPEITYRAFADACYGMKQYTDAAYLYQYVIKINPKNKAVHNRLGMLSQHMRKYDKAERSYQRAVVIDPECKEGYYNLGRFYFLECRYGLARKATQTALKIDPRYACARQLWQKINRAVAAGVDALGQPHNRKIIRGVGDESGEGPWVSIGTDGSISPTDTGGKWVKGIRRQV